MGVPVNLRPDLQVRVAGAWLSSLVPWGDLAFSGSWPGGCKELSFTATADYGTRLSQLVGDALVELCWGGLSVWSGNAQEPQWSGSQVSVTAQGASRLGEHYAPLDSGGGFTDNASTAATEAAARGLSWAVDPSVPNVSLGATTTYANVSGLLDDHATQSGTRWAVDAARRAYFATDPTTPSLHVRSGAGDLGIATDDFASNVVLIYNDSGTSAVETAVYPPFGTVTDYERVYGHKEWVKDITGQSAMTAGTAAGIAQAVYERTKQAPGYTNGLQLAYGEILNAVGVPVHPARVALEYWGRMLRLHGVPDAVRFTPYTDFVVGEAGWSRNDGTVTVNPVGLAARDQESVATEVIEALVKAGVLLGEAG